MTDRLCGRLLVPCLLLLASAAGAPAAPPSPPQEARERWLRGNFDEAQADYECVWFVRAYNDQDVQDPERLLLVGLATAEHARRHNLADQFGDVLNDVFGEAAKKDKAFWPAHYQSALLLLEKYNRGEAL